MKLFLIAMAVLIAGQQLWFLTDLQQKTKASAFKVHIPKLPVLRDINRSLTLFFDPEIWKKTKADVQKPPKKINKNLIKKKAYDENTTVELVMSKGSRKLCRGKKCITIRGIISQTLLLQEDNGTMISMQPDDVVFGNVTLREVHDTELLFTNNKTGESYKLEFFAYRQKRGNNETNSTYGKIKKDKK